MSRKLPHGAVMALLIGVALAPGATQAQPVARDTDLPARNVPARNANVWDGRHHEPAAGAVRAKERSAGIAPSGQQQDQQNDTLDRIGRQLTEKANRDAATAPPQPRPPNPSGR